jgi:hypothetical protein
MQRQRAPYRTILLFAVSVAVAAGCSSRVPPEPQRCGRGLCPCTLPATGTGAGVVPSKAAAPAAPGSTPTVFAISKLYFGDTARDGTFSSDAWSSYGLNIDGKVTGAGATDACDPVPSSDCESSLDGNDGIDNSFGENVLPLVVTLLGSDATSIADDAIHQGGATTLIRLDGLGSADDYSLLPGSLYRAIPTAVAPKWDGSDLRDVDARTVVGGDRSQPTTLLPNAYMTGRVWVAGPASGPVYLDAQIVAGPPGGPALVPPLPIQRARIVMQVAPDGTSATGTLTGIARTDDVRSIATVVAETTAPRYCGAADVGSIVDLFAQASDIMIDGTNEPGQTCDGISIGLGFDAVAVQIGQVGSEPPPPQPCVDAGGGG